MTTVVVVSTAPLTTPNRIFIQPVPLRRSQFGQNKARTLNFFL